MSTLSGNASKGEKTKPKFQSLDINNLYKISRGENTEKPTQKTSSSYIKHGMQSLGKVPNARRAPANLPSLKSETNDSSAAVPLVPPGATGWGKQEQGGTQTASAPAPQNGAPPNQSSTVAIGGPPQLTPHQQAIAIPSTNVIPPHNKHTSASAAGTSGAEKLWSAVMAGGQPDGGHPPAYQSPQFQHEFPSLSSGDAAGGSGSQTTDYSAGGPVDANHTGLSLRPQTEGSWTQGGQRPSDIQARVGSGVLGGAPQVAGQGGRSPETVPPQMRGVLPPFMYKGSFQQGGAPTSQFSHASMHSVAHGGGRRSLDGRPPRLQDRDISAEELIPRPIIREEELNKLDELGHDLGWAASDDIDYNQKLTFSDDEDRPIKKQQTKSQDVRPERQSSPKQWGQQNNRGRQSDEDDVIAQKHRHQKEVDLAIQRAKQRKEEEEKRFNEESRQRAQKKLQELNEKVREKRDRDRESEVGTISPSAVPPKPINHVEIPLPEFQKEKEKDQKLRGPAESPPKDDFRSLTQLESKTFPRKTQQKPDHREQNGPTFSRQFQNDLPPRFMKHQQRSGGQSYPHDSGRWSTIPRASSRINKSESPERQEDDRKEYKRQNSDESYRSSLHVLSDFPPQKSPSDEFHSKRDEDKWQKGKVVDSRYDRKPDTHERYYDDKKEKFDRPQRPDSRDSHTSHGSQGSNRRSRDSDLREFMGSWNEDVEASYEDKIEIKEEKRTVISLVPGPITRDRIEAEDANEKRNLTQLKKGEIPITKNVDPLKNSDKSRSSEKIWSESAEEQKKVSENKDVEIKKDDFKDKQNRNNRGFSQANSWGSSSSSSDFHARSGALWGHKRQAPRWKGGREFYGHGTDSDGSTDTYSVDSKDSKQAPKKPFDKDDKNRDNKLEKHVSDQKRQEKQEKDRKETSGYVPKGEPSRHGRGGGNNFRGSRMGGLEKRIYGYGPPPSKSPFSHLDEKEKKNLSDDVGASDTSLVPDKIKQNQEALAAGIIGKSRQDEEKNKRGRDRSKPDHNKSKIRKEDEVGMGDYCDKRTTIGRSSSQKIIQGDRRGVGNERRDRNVTKTNTDKKSGSFDSKKSDIKPDPQNLLANAIADISLKNRDTDDSKNQREGTSEFNGDLDGFQEVKNKKTAVKDRPKSVEEKKGIVSKNDTKDIKSDKKPISHQGKSSSTHQMTAQQIQNIPPLMSTPVNPPQILPGNKGPYDPRSRDNRHINPAKLPPRFAKQQREKMQKQMQHQLIGEMGELGKLPYGMRDNAQVVQSSSCSSWDKPSQSLMHKTVGSQLQSSDHDAANLLGGVSMDGVVMDSSSLSPGPASGTNNDKLLGKSSQITDKTILDGTTPPVNTIIFENTNFKSAPGARSASRNSASSDKPRSKLEENIENNVFSKPINDFLQKSDNSNKSDPIQITFKEESDMKLDFFGTDLTHLTDEKSSKNLCMSKSITSVNSTICNADSLNMKIASVKKVWETSDQETGDSSGISFGAPLDTVFKGNDAQDEHHEGFSPGSNQATSSTNVCKVKPTQQVSSATGQTVSSTSQQSHSALVGHPMLLGTPLSPPPMAATAVGVSLGPQQYAANQHLTGFPSAATAQNVAAAGSAQYNISAIPSPPTVLYNSTQQIQSGLYGAFLPPADQASVLGTQGHARAGGFGQYTPAAGAYHSLGQPANSPYNTQSVYLPTAPHPPPTAQAPPELYPSMNSFRLSAAGPFGQNQALNNPTGAPATVLISSSTSNSLMSASVKPSSQPISAIGTKAGGVGQAYQQQSQQGQQVYMTYEPAIQAANYLPGAGVMQRGPTGPPVQNSVVPGLQPSSSYYSGSTGGQTGYYQQPGNSSLPSAPQLQQHQAGFGLQGNVFGTHSQSHTNTGLQGSFPFLSTQMQVAAALSAQQYRSAAASLQNPYLKNVGNAAQLSGDQQNQHTSGGQRQQLKTSSSQEALSSVFNSAPQVPSPKSRQNNKHTTQQSSPTTQRKYFYPGVGNQPSNVQQRYPPPIQRPINFQQQSMNSMQNNSSNQKQNRNNSNKAPNRQYYGGQSVALSTGQNDKSENSKVSDLPQSATKSANVDIAKDNIKDDSSMIKE